MKQFIKLSSKQVRSIKKHLFCYGMLLPALFGFCLYYVYVNFSSIMLAFKVVSDDGVTRFGFGNFTRFFQELFFPDSVFSNALLNTLKIFLIGLTISFPLSLLFSYFIYKRIRGYKTFRFIMYTPCVIMSTIEAAVFKQVIGSNGPLNEICNMVGVELPKFLSDSRYALNTIIFYDIFFGLGGSFVIMGGGNE